MCKESQTKTALDPGSEEVFHLIFFPRKKRSWGQKNGQKIGTEEDWELCPPLTLGTKAKSYTVQKNSFFRVTVPPTNRPTNQPTVLLPPSTHLAFLFLLFWSRTKGGKRKKTESRSWQRQLSTTMLPPTTKEDGRLLLYYVPPTTLAFFLRPPKRVPFLSNAALPCGMDNKKNHGGNDTAWNLWFVQMFSSRR